MRMIDADALIEEINCSADMGGILGKVVDEVKLYAKVMAQATPTIETQRWIPITEAEPGAAHVLATLRWDDDDYEVTELDYWVIVAAQDDEDYLISDRAKGIIEHVVAWMPLPEPWRGEEK